MSTYMYLVVLRLGKRQRVVPLSHRMHLCLWARAYTTVSLRRLVTGTANIFSCGVINPAAFSLRDPYVINRQASTHIELLSVLTTM